MKKATINNVAEYAGVSKKTVSRVINDEPNVSDKTKDKVKAAFEALSYKPSPQARGLASNQSFLIALIYDNPNKSYINDIQTGALSICNREGYHLVIHPTDHENVNLLENFTAFISESQLDGLLLTPPFSDMLPLLEILDKSGIPYVRISPTLNKNASSCVLSNDEEASYEITQHLISIGHSDIGFIKGHPSHNVSEQRFRGYKKALEENNIPFKKQYITQGYFDFKSGAIAASKLLELPEPPTAIFASNDSMAAGVLKVANQKNITTPKELSITGFDDDPISRHVWPSLTTIQHPVKIMATKAMEILIKSVRNESIESNSVQFNSKLIIRESCFPLLKQTPISN